MKGFKITFNEVQNYKEQLEKFLKNRIEFKYHNKIPPLLEIDNLDEFLIEAEKLRPFLRSSTVRHNFHGSELANIIKKYSPTRILDYGSNNGTILVETGKLLNVSSTCLYGIDIFDNRTIKGYNFALIDPITNDINFIEQYRDFADIDVVIASMVFHHVVDLDKVIDTISSMMKRRGKIILREHDVVNKDFGSFLDLVHLLYYVFKMIDIPIDTYHSNYYSFKPMKEKMHLHGFKLIRVLRSNNYGRAYYAVYEKL